MGGLNLKAKKWSGKLSTWVSKNLLEIFTNDGNCLNVKIRIFLLKPTKIASRVENVFLKKF